MIGIIGGYGNIGIEAADIIKTNSSEMIRVAGRNISKVSQRAKELFASDKWFQIKESSSNEWKDFIKGYVVLLAWFLMKLLKSRYYLPVVILRD